MIRLYKQCPKCGTRWHSKRTSCVNCYALWYPFLTDPKHENWDGAENTETGEDADDDQFRQALKAAEGE